MHFKQKQELYSIIGRNIKKYRIARELTTQQLATKIGVTHIKVDNFEQGHQHIPLYNISIISKALSVGLSDLLPDQTQFR